MTHNLAGGIVVIKEDKILLVKQRNGWGLPKGSTEEGETFWQTARREGYEETGLIIEPGNVAFITEFKSYKYRQYLQVYYSGSVSKTNEPSIKDPDLDIFDVKFVNINELRDYIKFLPWIIPLENWCQNRELKYYCLDLDKEDSNFTLNTLG